jgi:hypothetical protein
MITIGDLKVGMGEKAETVLGSLAFVAWLANKFIAHFTEKVNTDQYTLSKVLIASQAIPIIITNHVYLAHGHAIPEYKNKALPYTQ